MNQHGDASAPACIVLAAGLGSRFGSDKRLARLADGRSLLDATLNSIPRRFSQYLLVLRPDDSALALQHAAQWQPVHAEAAAHGMGHSLAAGLAACRPCNAALVVLADMPHVSTTTYVALLAALRRDRIAVPRHAGQRGNPVGIGSDFFEELQQAQGDRGARLLLERHPQTLHWVDVEDPGIHRDVDTPADLQG